MALDDLIQIAFTIAPAVRRITYHEPESLPIEDLAFRYAWSQGATLPGGLPMLDAVRAATRFLAYLEPGEARRFELDVAEGIVSGFDFLGRTDFAFEVRGPRAPGLQGLGVELRDGSVATTVTAPAPGRFAVMLANRASRRAAAGLMNLSFEMAAPVPVIFPPFLSGKRLLLTPAFRELFHAETLHASTGIAVRSLAILFTDLKGSTALYERIGDLPAFALVQQHFDRLGKAVREQGGAIVKTIGDAVMAAFGEPAAAVRAALAMLREIDAFNREQGRREIILKIGIHAGASIAVTLNDRLDYFGQAVNIAARVQGLAEADEIYLTDAVYSAPGVPGALVGHRIEPRQAQLKGIARPVPVVRVSPVPG